MAQKYSRVDLLQIDTSDIQLSIGYPLVIQLTTGYPLVIQLSIGYPFYALHHQSHKLHQYKTRYSIIGISWE